MHLHSVGDDAHFALLRTEGVRAHPEPAPFPLDVHRAVGRCIRESAQTLERRPRLRPAVRRSRSEADLGDRIRRPAGGVLHEEPAGLELDVLAVRVGQEILPDPALTREGPEPDLLTGHLPIRRGVHEAVAGIAVVAAEEVLVNAHDVVRLVSAEAVLVVLGEDAARGVDRPRMRLTGVPEVRVAGDGEHEVVAREGRARHPVVVRLLERSRVLPAGTRLEGRGVGGESYLHPPARARREVGRTDVDADAPVLVRSRLEVDRRRGGRGVTDDAEVELDAAGGPRTAQRDVAEFHDLVAVHEFVAGRLHAGAPHLPADLGQDPDLDPLVLEVDHRPLAVLRLVRVRLEAVVRIEAGVVRQDRDPVGRPERVRGEDATPDRDPGRGRRLRRRRRAGDRSRLGSDRLRRR